MNTLRDLFEFELRSIYYVEHRLVQVLSKLIGESTDPAIKQAFVTHREETRGQVDRLERLFNMLGTIPSGTISPSVEGLEREGEAFVQEQPMPGLLDLFNLTAGAKSERLEITSYEGLITMAKAMGLPHAVEIFQSNLQEELAALERLQHLQTSFNLAQLNVAAEPLKEVGFDASLPGERPGAVAGRDIIRDS